MKRKFILGAVCAITAISLVSMPAQAKTINSNNNKQTQCSETSSQEFQQNKPYIEKIEESPSTILGNKEIKNSPKLVKGILSAPMSRNFDNIIKFFEDNKDIFRISDPKNQLILQNDSCVFRLTQVVNGMTTDNTYIVAFNENNQIKSVYGTFDNSLYDPNSEANVEPRITKGQALDIAKADGISYILRNDRLTLKEKASSINFINNVKLANADIKLHLCKYTGYNKALQGKNIKTYKIKNLGSPYIIWISVTSGEIVSTESLIWYNK